MRSSTRFTAFLLCVCVLLFCCSCGETETEQKGSLSAVVLSDTYAAALKHGAEDCGESIGVSVVPADAAVSLLSGSDVLPDIIMLTQDTLAQAVNSGKLAPLSVDTFGFYPFTVEPAYKGKMLYAVPWHVSPGLFAYRKSLAGAYFGTDEPEQISKILSDWDSFAAAAQLLKTASDGKTSIVAGTDDIALSYLACDVVLSDGDIVSGSDLIASYLDYAKLFTDNGYTAGAEQWSDAWLKGMSDSQSVFGYFLSEVAVNDVLAAQCGDSSGDWAVIAPFAPYVWGGAWLAVPAESRHKTEAVQLLSSLSRPAEAKAICLYSGLFTPQRSVNLSVASDAQFAPSALGGQSLFTALDECAQAVAADRKTQGLGSDNLALIVDGARKYAAGKMTKEEALAYINDGGK